MLNEIETQVQFCLDRNDDNKVKEIFFKWAGCALPQEESSVERAKTGADKPSVRGVKAALDKDQLHGALSELGLEVNKEFLDEVFQMYDADRNEKIELEEFKFAARRRTKLEQWTATMPLIPLVASCFAPFLLRAYAKARTLETADNGDSRIAAGTDQSYPGDDQRLKPALTMLTDPDPLSRIRGIKPEDLTTVCLGLKDGFHKLIEDRLKRLQAAYDGMKVHEGEKRGAADQEVGKFAFCMQGGETSDFYSGLGVRVGADAPNPHFHKRLGYGFLRELHLASIN